MTTAPSTRRRRGAAAYTAVGAGAVAILNTIARAIAVVAAVVALLIVVGIALVVLKANPANSLVSWFHDTAHFLAGPFNGAFKPKDPKVATAVNWGIAALVYLVVGRLIARLLRR
jgi:hypothetical protein